MAVDERKYKEIINAMYGSVINAYRKPDVENTSIWCKIPKIKKVIFNNPATIVLWFDDTKTVVKADGEKFDQEKGLAMAIAKKALGNKGNYFNTFKKWVTDPGYEIVDCDSNWTATKMCDVVRCEECKYWERNEYCEINKFYVTNKNYFCASGRRGGKFYD